MIIEKQPYGLHPQDRAFVVDQLNKGKAGIVPTDTVYAFCCQADQKTAYESICRLKRIDPKDALMSMVCKDLSQASHYFTQWETPTYRLLHKNLPGPFTFILNAGHHAPAFLKNKRKTLGLRVPDHQVIQDIMAVLPMPLMVSSVTQDNEFEPFYTDTEKLIREFEKQVGFIILDPDMMQEPSTLIDATVEPYEVVRQSRHELKG